MAGGKLISTGVEFPDATTQTTSALPLTGGTMTGALTTTGFTSTGIDDNATGTKLTISDTTITGVGAFTSTSIDATKLSGALPAIDGSALTGVTNLQLGTAVATTSGTSIDFTSIPSGVKRISLIFSGVRTNGTSGYLVQLGSGSVSTSGYVSFWVRKWTSQVNVGSSTSGFFLDSDQTTQVHYGVVDFVRPSGNLWVLRGNLGTLTGTTLEEAAFGQISLGGAVDRLRLTTPNGTDSFNLGQVNINWEV